MEFAPVSSWNCSVCRKAAVIFFGPLTCVVFVICGAIIGVADHLKIANRILRNAWNGSRAK